MDDQTMQQAIDANGQLSSLKLIAASTASVWTAPVVSSYVTDSNWDVYAGVGQQLDSNISAGATAALETAPGDPVIFTELGVSSSALSSSDWGVAGSDATQGLIDVNALLDAFYDGVQRSFLYELMDDNHALDQEDNFGLFDGDGTPKAAAIDLHDLTAILSDVGASASMFTVSALNFTVQNLPSTASSMLLEKSTGAFDIVLWNGTEQLVNTTSDTLITPTTPVAVQLGTVYQNVEVFDPIETAIPIETFSNVGSVVIQFAADPIIIEIAPKPTVTTYSPGNSGGTIKSIGEDTVDVGTGAVTVQATGETVSVQGGVGALTYEGTAKAIITGGSGTMNVTLNGSDSQVTGGSGNLTIIDAVGGNTITGGAGNVSNGMTVTTTTGNDIITTGAWTATNRVTLGAGSDTVVANGSSAVIGTTGNDIITVSGWWASVATSTAASRVTLSTYGWVQTNGSDLVTTNSGLTLEADGPTTQLSAGGGYVWMTAAGAVTVTGGIGGGDFDVRQTNNAILTTESGATDTISLGNGSVVINASGNDTIFAGGGAATISSLAGTTQLTGGAGAIKFIERASNASVAVASGAAEFDLTNGLGGGSLTISGFKVGIDSLHLQNYGANGIKSDQAMGSSTQIVLSDNTKIILIGVDNPTRQPFFL